MKKIIATLIFLAFAVSAFAQIEYLPTENRHSGYGTPPKPQRTSEVVTTTAYTISGDSYVKARIRVQVTDNGYGRISMQVIERYENSIVSAQWNRVYNSGPVQQCRPIPGGNHPLDHPLESKFMYKVNINGTIWYFDL